MCSVNPVVDKVPFPSLLEKEASPASFDMLDRVRKARLVKNTRHVEPLCSKKNLCNYSCSFNSLKFELSWRRSALVFHSNWWKYDGGRLSAAFFCSTEWFKSRRGQLNVSN